eukprot:maker-scaffold_69-snap-gene-0.55-mRNA-1 protein AED:0.11 eAED:0.89 QI:105/0/0.5/1/0/0/2/0/283
MFHSRTPYFKSLAVTNVELTQFSSALTERESSYIKKALLNATLESLTFSAINLTGKDLVDFFAFAMSLPQSANVVRLITSANLKKVDAFLSIVSGKKEFSGVGVFTGEMKQKNVLSSFFSANGQTMKTLGTNFQFHSYHLLKSISQSKISFNLKTLYLSSEYFYGNYATSMFSCMASCEIYSRLKNLKIFAEGMLGVRISWISMFIKYLATLKSGFSLSIRLGTSRSELVQLIYPTILHIQHKLRKESKVEYPQTRISIMTTRFLQNTQGTWKLMGNNGIMKI